MSELYKYSEEEGEKEMSELYKYSEETKYILQKAKLFTWIGIMLYAHLFRMMLTLTTDDISAWWIVMALPAHFCWLYGHLKTNHHVVRGGSPEMFDAKFHWRAFFFGA